MEIVTFPRNDDVLPKWVVDFLVEKHISKKMEIVPNPIVNDFECEKQKIFEIFKISHFSFFCAQQPTISRPSRIATTQLMFLILLVVQLVPQFRSSQIDEVLNFGDSTIILHKIGKIQMNCPEKF